MLPYNTLRGLLLSGSPKQSTPISFATIFVTRLRSMSGSGDKPSTAGSIRAYETTAMCSSSLRHENPKAPRFGHRAQIHVIAGYADDSSIDVPRHCWIPTPDRRDELLRHDLQAVAVDPAPVRHAGQTCAAQKSTPTAPQNIV
jgi:hypothetical protein